jgi:hypothetical protein
MKKNKLNRQLLTLQLRNAQDWGNLWNIIYNDTQESINLIMDKKYRTLNNKLHKLEEIQPLNIKHHRIFYPRVANNTNITFTPEELILLNKGLKYNLSFKKKNWIESLALEASETAISLLLTREQEHTRFRVAHNVRQLYKQFDPSKPEKTRQYNSMQAKKEFKTISKIREKLELHNAIILKADKGNTTVIEYADPYYNKIQDFISNNELKIIKKVPTNRFQNKIRMAIKECTSSIPKENRSKYINLNPSAPTIRGLMKIHKNHCPIRPVINWNNAPTYKLARLLNKLITLHIPLPYIYNVKNTLQLM